MDNRPKGREKHTVGEGKDLYKRGDGLGTGPVGSADGHAGRTGGSSGGGKRAGGGRSSLVTIVLAAILLLGGGGGAGLSGLLGGLGGTTGGGSTQSGGMSAGLSSLLGSFGSVSTGWTAGSNTGRLNTSVAPTARAKRTNIVGNGKDTVTVMVYMCGTDLESKYGMGTSDLQEMMAATLSDKVNVIVYTGGCKQWKNATVSNSVNEIYKVESGGLRRLEQDKSAPAMTDPATLTGFIQYCMLNYPANRNMLIFWDHGGGSLSGYGYDEKNAGAGSMSLSGINEALAKKALTDTGAVFDFIGFDACLMATLENALMLTKYADYLIASEETEPGVGWYYTNWLTELSKNTSMPTLEIGKNIVDDFVGVCAQKCAGQDTTLSVVDLAELEATVPEKFKDFAVDTLELQNSDYKTVSTARGSTREFASSSKIDQVDLVHLASNLATEESKALADTLLSAVKYNKTSSTISNAYGLSIYFPYQKTSKVSSAAATYEAIGMDDEYTECIRQFASMGAAGQTVSGSVSSYASNPLASLLGTAASSGSGVAGSDMISQLLMSALTSSLTGGRSLDVERATEYLAENQFDSSQLVWVGDTPQIKLSEEQWGLVNDVLLNVFYDDGYGYIDLGLDNVFTFTDDGALLGEYDGTWLSIDRQPVAYYHTSTVYDGDDYTISGYVPCLVNGARAELLLVFDTETPYGYIAGYRTVYDETVTETVPKSVDTLESGDMIDFIFDYYGYDGSYQDSYRFGDAWAYHEDALIGDVTIDASRANAVYRFTDVYGQNYWTPQIP